MSTQLFRSELVAACGSPRCCSWIGAIGRRLAIWLDACADHRAAAALYQQLSCLSDAELARRGLSRATLACDVAATAPHRDERT
jgi:hypothetical protein